MADQKSKLEALCAEKGLKMTDQRRVIARVLSESHDHPDVEALHKRATAVDPPAVPQLVALPCLADRQAGEQREQRGEERRVVVHAF